MKKAILISLLSFFAICAIIALIAGGFALFRGEQILNVSGSGDVMVEPDTAYVSLSVDVMRRTAQKAQAADASIMQDVLASIEKLGIAKSDIQTASFNIWPEIRYENNQAPKTVGWRWTLARSLPSCSARRSGTPRPWSGMDPWAVLK